MNGTDRDILDVRELWASVRARWSWVALGTAAGLGAALLLLFLAVPRYEATAEAILQGRGSEGSPMLRDLGGLAEAFSLPGRPATTFETELEVLTSRTLIRRTIRDLGLQVQVREPEGLTADSLFEGVQVEPLLPGGTYRFQREGDAYRVDGPGAQEDVQAGGAWSAPGVRLVFRQARLPGRFEIEVLDLRDAVEWVEENLETENPGGVVAAVTFRAHTPELAAAVPNTLVAHYLEERTVLEAGVDQERLIYLETLADSVRQELTAAGAALRRHLERQGTYDPNRLAEMERAAELRGRADEMEVELQTLDRIVGRGTPDTLTVADLAAFPTFLRNAVVNDLLGRLMDLHTERAELLERRTPRDPEVEVLTGNIRYLEDELLALARSYRENLVRNLASLSNELERYRRELADRPAEEEARFALESDVDRLTTAYLGLQSQLVQTRLGQIRANDTRQIETAVPPREPVFPRPFLFVALGLMGGALLGLTAAVFSGQLSHRVASPHQVTVATGLPAVSFASGRPILLGGAVQRSTLLVTPVGQVGGGSADVARRIADTAVLRGHESALLDLTAERLPSGREEGSRIDVEGGGSYPVYPLDGGGAAVRSRTSDLRRTLAELEEQFSLVVVALPGLDDSSAAALIQPDRQVILVAGVGETEMDQLREASEALTALGVTVSGVVVRNGSGVA